MNTVRVNAMFELLCRTGPGELLCGPCPRMQHEELTTPYSWLAAWGHTQLCSNEMTGYICTFDKVQMHLNGSFFYTEARSL